MRTLKRIIYVQHLKGAFDTYDVSGYVDQKRLGQDQLDYLFIFATRPGESPGPQVELSELVDAWNHAPQQPVNPGDFPPIDGGNKRRSIHFFPVASQAAVENLGALIIKKYWWGKFHYWAKLPDSQSACTFPLEQIPNNPPEVRASQWSFHLNGARVNTLDDMAFTCDQDSDLLKIRHHPIKVGPSDWQIWYRDINTGKASSIATLKDVPELYLDFGTTPQLRMGALKCRIIPTDPSQATSKLSPFYFPVEVAYSKLTYDPTATKKAFVQNDVVLKGCPFSKHTYDPTDPTQLALHPGDDFGTAPAQSHIYFPDATGIYSNLTTDKGSPLNLTVVTGPSAGICRLNYQIQSGTYAPLSSKKGKKKKKDPNPPGVWKKSGSLIDAPGRFVPDFQFAVTGPTYTAPSTRTLTEAHRVLTGCNPTEFIELKVGDVLTFSAGPAALLLPGDPKYAANDLATPKDTLHGLNNLVTTSWLTVETAYSATFSSQPSKSPLFVPAPLATTTNELKRDRLNYSTLSDHSFIPFFPWKGFTPSPAGNSVAASQSYEGSHLARQRRVALRPTANFLKARGKRDTTTDHMGITPQGIIAKIEDDNFIQLYFGVPDPTAPGDDPTKPPPPPEEFSIKLASYSSIPGAYPQAQDLQRELQIALRGENLFLVIYKPPDYVPKTSVIEFSEEVRLAKFSFKLKSSLNATGEGVFILKYYRGVSLKDLVGNTSLWACRDYLASTATTDIITQKCTLTGDNAAEWKPVWEDPDWQGIVFLDFAFERLERLIEALGAGMNVSNFRFHHLGLTYLPVTAGDLKVTPLKPEPTRTGSAFGLLHYDGKGQTTPSIGTGDTGHIPGPTPPTTDYGFVANSVDVAFQHSKVTRFNADVDVGFSHLFWDSVSPDSNPRKTIKLLGSYEARDATNGSSSDSQGLFRLRTNTPATVTFNQGFLKEFDLSEAELSVTSIGEAPLEFFIGIKGDLIFDSTKELFNLAHVSKVHLEKFGLQFDYYPKDTSKPTTCRFVAEGVRVDIDFDGVKDSVMSIFPMTVKGLKIALDKSLDFFNDLHYYPIRGGSLFDFAFDVDIDLGWLGGLAGTNKSLTLPALIGWCRAGAGLNDLGFAIQFPNLSMDKIELGIQQFVAIRAESAALGPCPKSGTPNAIGIILQKVSLAFFGTEWPTSNKPDLAIFVNAAGERKVSWMFGLQGSAGDPLAYLGAGQRISLPTNGNADSIISQIESSLVTKGKDVPCGLLGSAVTSSEGWLVALKLQIASGLVDLAMVLDDAVPLYALDVTFAKIFNLSASYRRIDDRLGEYSAETNLSKFAPPLQFGAASGRMPTVRLDVYTDGGWLVDIGFPWNNDFSRSMQFELGIFLGSAGFYFGHTALDATTALILNKDENGYGYLVPKDVSVLSAYKAYQAGFAFRVGLGRSVDLGVLTGEASISVFGTLEGAAVFRDDGSTRLYSYRGVTGIMVLIEADLNFIVLQASVKVCAYVETIIEIRKVLGHSPVTDKDVAVSLPFTIAAEVGLYFHFELWVRIGCVSVKLADLNFSAKWRFEESFGSASDEPFNLRQAPQGRLRAPAKAETPWHWNPTFALKPGQAKSPVLYLCATVLPAAANTTDVTGVGPYTSCMIGQLMLDSKGEFIKLAKFVAAWALDLDTSTNIVLKSTVEKRRQDLRKPANWSDGIIVQKIHDSFEVKVRQAPQDTDPKKQTSYCMVPAWPGVTWGFAGGQPNLPQSVMLPPGQGISNGQPGVGDAQLNAFLDFIRLMTESFLREIDGVIQKQGEYLYDSHTNAPVDQKMDWNKIWGVLTTTS